MKIKKTRCISRIKIRTIRTILGLQNKKSVQSVHFGHPAVHMNPFTELPKILFKEFGGITGMFLA